MPETGSTVLTAPSAASPARTPWRSNDPLGCWTKINVQFPNLTSVQDTTTWSAQIQGDPVRLIE